MFSMYQVLFQAASHDLGHNHEAWFDACSINQIICKWEIQNKNGKDEQQLKNLVVTIG